MESQPGAAQELHNMKPAEHYRRGARMALCMPGMLTERECAAGAAVAPVMPRLLKARNAPGSDAISACQDNR